MLGDGADITRSWSYDRSTLRLGTIRAGTSQLGGTWNLVDLSYTHTDSGNVASITDALNSSQVECFDYDLHNRLIDAFTGDDCTGYDAGVGSGPYDQDFSYSAIHTITSFDGASYTYGTGNDPGAGDAGPHAVTSISSGAVTFGYDDNGNRITRTENSQTTSYSYGDDNRLDQVTLPDTSTVEFVYDADGNRVSRSNGDDSTRYIAGLMEIDLDQTTVTETRTFYSFAGTSVAVRAHDAGTVAYSFGNHLGSPVASFEDTTNTVSRMGYEPYGTERAVTGALPSDHRFTNQIADNTTAASGGTGLLFYNARYYDPAVGAFVAADTLIPNPTSPVDFNRYAYVRDNPVNATDPSGHSPSFTKDGGACPIGKSCGVTQAVWRRAIAERGGAASSAIAAILCSACPKSGGIPATLRDIHRQIVEETGGEYRDSARSLGSTPVSEANHQAIVNYLWEVRVPRAVATVQGIVRPQVEHTQRIRALLPKDDRPARFFAPDSALGYIPSALTAHAIETRTPIPHDDPRLQKALAQFDRALAPQLPTDLSSVQDLNPINDRRAILRYVPWQLVAPR